LMWSSEEDSQGPVIRDRRRVDPVTGQVRDAEAAAGPVQAGASERGGPGEARPGRHAGSKPGGSGPSGAPAAGGATETGAQGKGPTAGASSQPSASAEGSGREADAELTARLAERTADLQRLHAEYANYRKRVERDRLAVREQALANVLTELLPVL